jgi:hypothetical protein
MMVYNISKSTQTDFAAYEKEFSWHFEIKIMVIIAKNP